jgi:hypothetical protein
MEDMLGKPVAKLVRRPCSPTTWGPPAEPAMSVVMFITFVLLVLLI